MLNVGCKTGVMDFVKFLLVFTIISISAILLIDFLAGFIISISKKRKYNGN
jgi:hypothetical protein